MASCGQLPSGSLTVRVRESALGQNVSTLELSDQTCQTPGRGLTAESGGLEQQDRAELSLRDVKYAPHYYYSVTHHGLSVLHHWNLLSQLRGSQAQLVQKWNFEFFFLRNIIIFSSLNLSVANSVLIPSNLISTFFFF